MAKGIAINGMLRGKLGGVVYSRVNGEQISRVKAEVVKNPKTTAQMAQRAIFATATQAYSIMKPIVDHSREGVKYGSKTQQKFMQDALALLRSRAAADDGNFLIPNVAALMANPYIVSKGSLTSPKNIAYDNGDDFVHISNMANQTVADGIVVTAKSFCDALGINKGDQVTLVAIVRDADQPVLGTYAGRDYRRNKFEYARITIKADAADNEIVYSATASDWGTAAIIEGFGENSFDIENIAATKMVFNYTGEMLAFACIRSSKVDGKWMRSTESLTLADDQLLYNFNDILPAWTDGSAVLEFESSRYLNNAEVEKPINTTYSLTKTKYIGENASGESQIGTDIAMVQKKAGDSTTLVPITDDNRKVYTLKANGHLLLTNLYSNSGIEYSVAQASKLIGQTLIIDQE